MSDHPKVVMGTVNLLQTGFSQFVNDAAFVSNKGSSAGNGDAYYNTTDNTLHVYINGSWTSLPYEASGGVTLNYVLYAGSSGQILAEATLATSRGGTALSGYTTGDLLYASSSSVLAKLAIGTTGQALKVVGGLPAWGTLAEVGGGTNQTAYTLGDLLYSSATNTLSKLAGNTTSTKKYLQQTGNGSVSAAPAWAALPTPTIQKFTSTGTTSGYLFTISTSSTVAVNDTYTNNSQTFTVQGALTAQSGQVLFCTGTGAPAASGNLTRSSGSGTATIAFTSFITLATYTTAASTAWIRVRMVGAGGGGMSGGTTGTVQNGGAGSNTVFGINLLFANGGGGGNNATVNGGTASIASPAIGTSFTGANGGGWVGNNAIGVFLSGGYGGNTPFGGGGIGGPNQAGVAPTANTGGGGGGGGHNGATTQCYGGQGGGAGGFVDAIIASPNSTYFYAIGTGGTAGGAGTSGFAGAAGAAGYIEVTEYPQ